MTPETQLQPTPPQPATPLTGQNLAPIDPLRQMQRGVKRPDSDLQKAIRERYLYFMNLEKLVRAELLNQGYLVANFIEGKQLLTRNRFGSGYLSYTPKNTTESTKRAINMMRFYSTNAVWKWQLSNPDIVAVMGVDTEQAREAAEAADIIIDHYEREFFTPFITIQEALQGLCWGSYAWRVRYDNTLYSVTAQQPVFGTTPVQLGEGFGQCGDCGFKAAATSFPNPTGPYSPCPNCGGDAVVEPPAVEQVPGVIGMQSVPLGDLRAELIPFPNSWWDISKRISDSSWLITEHRVGAASIRRFLGDVRVPGDPGINLGLDIADKLGWTGEGGGGQAAVDWRKRRIYEEPVVVGEISLSPDDIADITIAVDEPTVAGISLPAGPLIDTFPRGLTVQYLNDCAVIVGLYDEHHSQSVVQGVWHAKPLSGTGQGMIDSVEVQKRMNAGDSQINAVFKAHGTPAMLYRQEALGDIDRADYIGHPLANIAINSQNLPEGMRLEDIVAPAFQPQSVPGEMFSYFSDRMNQAFQITSHITDFSGGLPGVNNRTATGAQITQANSNALFTPPLQIKGEVRKRMAEIVIRLYRKHFPVDRYFALKGRYGRAQGRYLSAANLHGEIKFEVVRDSELPRNDFTKREDYTAFFMMLGGAAGYAALRQQVPELVTEVERVFNLQMHSEAFDEVASLCQQRIQQMKAVAQMVLNPQMLLLAIQPSPVLEEPSHDLKAKWLSDWLDTDEGQTTAPNLRDAVRLLIQFHFTTFGQQQAAMAMLTGAVQGAGASAGAETGPAPNDQNGKHDSAPGASTPDTNPQQRITGRPKPQK